MKKIQILLISLFILSGCSVVSVSTDYDPKINIPSYKTYAIINYAHGDSLINNRVNDALSNELALKGYTLVDDSKADFLVLYIYTAKDKSRTTTEYVGGMRGYYGRYGGYYATSTYNYTEGNFEIRMADPKTQETFWRATGINTLKSFNTPQERTNYTNEVVHEMLKKYPLTK